MIILTGCHPMYFISAMLGVKKNEDNLRLIGGNALDEQGITWGVDDSTRLQMIGRSGSTVIVKGLQAGTVTVTASHPQSVDYDQCA